MKTISKIGWSVFLLALSSNGRAEDHRQAGPVEKSRPVANDNLLPEFRSDFELRPKSEPTGNRMPGNPKDAGLPPRSGCGQFHDAMARRYPSSSNIDLGFCNSSDFRRAVEWSCDWIGWGSYEGSVGFFTRSSFLNHCNQLRRQEETRYGHLYYPQEGSSCYPMRSGSPTYPCQFTNTRRPTNATIGSGPSGFRVPLFPATNGDAYNVYQTGRVRQNLNNIRSGSLPLRLPPVVGR